MLIAVLELLLILTSIICKSLFVQVKWLVLYKEKECNVIYLYNISGDFSRITLANTYTIFDLQQVEYIIYIYIIITYIIIVQYIYIII